MSRERTLTTSRRRTGSRLSVLACLIGLLVAAALPAHAKGDDRESVSEFGTCGFLRPRADQLVLPPSTGITHPGVVAASNQDLRRMRGPRSIRGPAWDDMMLPVEMERLSVGFWDQSGSDEPELLPGSRRMESLPRIGDSHGNRPQCYTSLLWPDFQVNESTGGRCNHRDPEFDFGPSSHDVLTWSDKRNWYEGVFFQRYDSNWSSIGGNTECAEGAFSSVAVDVAGSFVIAWAFGSMDGYLYALRSGGTMAWRYQIGGWVYTSPAIGSDGMIYVGSEDGYIYAITSDGTLEWRYEADGPVGSSPTIGSDGTIYSGTGAQSVYAVGDDGGLQWQYATDGAVGSSPAIASDGTIYIGSMDGALYALTSTSMGLASSPWPKFQHDNMNTGRTSGP